MGLKFAYQTPWLRSQKETLKTDKQLHIVTVAEKKDLEKVLGPLTDQQYYDHAVSRLPEGVDWVQLPDDWTPPDSDRSFRNAWRLKDGKTEVDMPWARELHKIKLREMREPLMAQLDVEYMLADERGRPAEKATIAQRKQALRDVTDDPAIEAAQTPDELRAAIPDILKVKA